MTDQEKVFKIFHDTLFADYISKSQWSIARTERAIKELEKAGLTIQPAETLTPEPPEYTKHWHM